MHAAPRTPPGGGGAGQRLGIACAPLNQPRVVVLDEPTLGLDPPGQRRMLTIIRRIAEERGATVLLCTHLLATRRRARACSSSTMVASSPTGRSPRSRGKQRPHAPPPSASPAR